MSNYSQMQAVAVNCSQYEPEVDNVMVNTTTGVSCATCDNWDGQRCKINVFDKVLASLDEE